SPSAEVAPRFARREVRLRRNSRVASLRGMTNRMLVMTKRTLASPRRYRAAGRWARRLLRTLPRALVTSRRNVGGRQRELPDPPAESFGEWYRRTHDSTTMQHP